MEARYCPYNFVTQILKKIKTMRKSILKTAGIIAIALFGLASCSSDDSNNGPGGGGGIDAAVGTYKGTLDPLGGDAPTYFDAILIVTKVDGNHLKITPKSGEPYSNYTSKTMKVFNNSNQAIFGDGNIPEGTFSYTISSKALLVQTREQSATDLTYTFQGTKQ